MTPQENLLKSLGYKDITKDNPIHFRECLGEFFESVYPYNKRFYKREGDISIELIVGNVHNQVFISGICYYSKGWQKFEVTAPSKYIDKMFKKTVNDVLYKIKIMLLEEKLTKLRHLADAMYEAALNMSTDASRLHKAMQDYRNFVISELSENRIKED